MQLDISKAFDKLSWPFLFKALAFFGFFERWIGLIKECVCSLTELLLDSLTPSVVLGREILYPLISSFWHKKSSTSTFNP